LGGLRVWAEVAGAGHGEQKMRRDAEREQFSKPAARVAEGPWESKTLVAPTTRASGKEKKVDNWEEQAVGSAGGLAKARGALTSG